MKNLKVKAFATVNKAMEFLLDSGEVIEIEDRTQLAKKGWLQTDRYHIVIDTNHEVTEKMEQQIPLLYSLFVCSIVVLAVFAIIRSFLLKW